MSAASDVPLVVALVLLAVILGVVGYYVIMRLRRRRQALSIELENSRELVEDRAFNQIQLTTAAANNLGARGVDVTKIRGLIDEAERASQRGDHDTALALARSAQESLARVQQSGATRLPVAPRTPPSVGAPAFSTMVALPPQGTNADDPLPEETTSPPAPRLPRNKVESHFQITLLTEEIGRTGGAPTAGTAASEASALRDQAQAASDRGDFTEALRLAVKGRRRIGGRLETLPATAATAAADHAEERDDVLVCGGCGEKLRPSDRFCRYCGTLRGPARCPSCGAPADEDGKFCAKCGASLSAPTP